MADALSETEIAAAQAEAAALIQKLEDAGVTFVGSTEPAIVDFVEEPLPEEPVTDRKLVLDDGTQLRERIVESAPNDGMGGRSLAITTAQLDSDGKVVMGSDGKPLLSRFERRFTAEGLANLGSAEAMRRAVEDARRQAAAKAPLEIEAQKVLDSLLGERTGG